MNTPTPPAPLSGIGQIFPQTAWEQIATVIVFAIVIYFLVRILRPILQDVRTGQSAMMKQMTDYITEHDRQWQAWMDKKDQMSAQQESRNITAIQEMGQSVIQLTTAVGILNADFRVHDAEEKAMLDVVLTPEQKREVSKRVRIRSEQRTQPLSTAPPPNQE